ncbi:MAG: hypothetical protein E7494_11215 [Ruminococcus albus]|jgi:hypothetical protein|nr:hypothetical protein [Ruminococcus albus]
MKKIISAVLSAAILGTSVFSVPFVSAETELITDSEKIYDLANGYVKENLSGDATVMMDEKGIVWISYRQLAIGEPEFNSDELQKFLQENNVDFTKIVIEHVDDSPVSSQIDTDKITDLEQIATILKNYIDENHPGDATVAIYDEDGSLNVTFRNTAVGEAEFDGESICRNMAKYLEENNVDPSYISNEFRVEFLTDAPETLVSTVTAGDINLNGTIDVTDLTELSLALIGDKELTAAQQKSADIDGDGAVTLADLARLQQYLSKKIDAL